jgi:hypothetical protein
MAARLAMNWNRFTTAAQSVAFFGGPGVTTGLAVTAGAGRLGDAGLVVTNAQGYVSRALANEASFVVGFALKGVGPCCILRAMDDVTEQCSIWLRTDGKIEARRGATVLGSGTATIHSAVHRWVEVGITVDATTGVVYVAVDGATDISLTVQDTNQTANEYATQIRFGEGAAASATVAFTLGDLYQIDATGGVNDTPLGMVRIRDVVAAGAGTTAQWTPNTGTGAAAIDDATPDDDTTYIASSTVGQISSFDFGNLSGTIASIPFVSVSTYGKRTDAGARAISHYVKVAADVDNSAALTHAAGAYDWQHSQYDVQPDASAWNSTDFNAAEFGVEVET